MALLGFGPISSAPVSSSQSRLLFYSVSLSDYISASENTTPNWNINLKKGLGVATLTFNSPGNNTAEVFISDPNIVSGASIGLFTTNESTVSANAEMHDIAEIRFSVKSIVSGSGFTLTGVSPYRLTGQYKVRYSWAYNGK